MRNLLTMKTNIAPDKMFLIFVIIFHLLVKNTYLHKCVYSSKFISKDRFCVIFLCRMTDSMFFLLDLFQKIISFE